MKRALSLVLVCTMLLSMLVFTPAAVAAEDPVASRFVIVSDTHITENAATAKKMAKVFDTAYAYAEEQGGKIDAFVFNGDSINGGDYNSAKDVFDFRHESEWRIFLNEVKEGIRPESKFLMSIARTHDIYDGEGNYFEVPEAKLNELIAEYLGTDGSIIPTADWGYDPHLNYVGGVPVLTLTNDIGNGNDVTAEDDGNTSNDDNADNSYHDSEAWLNTELAKLVAENPNRPIFVVFHYPEVGKLGWTQRWGQNSLRDTLNKYPQVIAVNAHVHWDPRMADSITQDQFTEVYDGGVRDVGGWGADSEIVSYSMIEVTQSGAVTIKYIDPETGDLLKEANGSGDVLEYSIPKAWDRSTYLYTDEDKFAVEKATFAADASIKLEDGKNLTFDRADSEHPVVYYRLEVNDGKTTKTQYISSGMLGKTLPETYSTTLSLKTGVNYTITVTAMDGLFRDSANTLTLSGNVNDPDLVLTGSATAVTNKTYGENGAATVDYPDFKTYTAAATNTDWGISDMADLKAWADFSKSNNCAGLTFHLENDIDMKDEPFGMIGSVYFPFKGKFDGHLHTLSNLLINDTYGMGTGFFVYTVDAEIKNFGIESGSVSGHVSNRKYENAGSYSLSGDKRKPFTEYIGVAAIAGRADNTDFSHVWNKADVGYQAFLMPEGNGFTQPCFAGLVGRAQSACTFVGCYNTGDVTGFDRASGITNWAQNGTSAARISNCFNLGTITTRSGAATEAIGRYNTVSANDYSYFCFNNYYLEGSADVATNRASATGYTAAGAEEPIALTAKEVEEDLADLLNAKRAYGYLTDTAEWATDAEGNAYISSVDNNVAEKVITISTADELNTFAANSKTNSYEGYTIVLKADIDMSGTADFAGIGNTDYPFKGIFDGNGFTISGMTISTADTTRGFFHKVEGGTVKNLTLNNASVKATKRSGIVTAEISNGALIENVQVIGGSITASDNNTFGFIAGIGAGTARNIIKNCIVDGATYTYVNNTGQGFGGIIGNSTCTDIDSCIVRNCNITGYRNSGLIVGYGYAGDITNCITYGNTYKSHFDTYGLIGRISGGVVNVENVVFYEETLSTTTVTDNTSDGKFITKPLCLCNFSSGTELNVKNVYTAATGTCTYATPIFTNATELASGKIAYELGWAMKDGYVAFADEDTAAAKRYTYKINDTTTEYRYTDSTGAIINGAPTVTDETFLGWKVTNDAKEGDLIYTAYYGTTDDGAYPISEFASHPKATKFTISTAEELCTFATLSKSNNFKDYTISLLNDIDLLDVEFAGIGSGGCHFMGTFDGGNHTVWNLTYSSTADYYGFFRALEGTVQNLTIEDANISVGAKDASGIAVAWAYGTTKLTNVKVRYSSISNTVNMVGGIIGWYNGGATCTLENCLVEGSVIDNLSSGMQQAGCLVGSASRNVIVKNCKVINTTVQAHRQVGLISPYSDILTVDGFIAYGNTMKANAGSAGLISGQLTNTTSLKNVVVYDTNGARNLTDPGKDETIPLNYPVFWLFGYQVNTAITGENVFTTTESDTCCALTPTTITKAQAKSGEIAYKLGYAMEYGNIAFPDTDTKAATKISYLVNGGEYDARYTDSTGAMIGTAPALPAGATTTEWQKVDDTTYSATMEYDVNGTYPISQFSIYSNAKNFTVSTAEEFKLFADLVTAGKTMSGVTIKQTATISLKDYPNVQVGNKFDDANATFAGTYDGQNFTISDYTLKKNEAWHGLFRSLSGTIKNLVIDHATLETNSHTGVLVGVTYGTSNLIENVHIKNSTVTTKQRRGTLLVYGFYGDGAIINVQSCTVSDSFLNTGTTAGNPAALITIRSQNSGSKIENTYAYGNTITVQAATTTVYGIAGNDVQNTVITNCGSFNNTYTGTAATIYGIQGSRAGCSINNCFTDEATLAQTTFNGTNNYTGVTEAELADGSLAYKLKTGSTTTYNWIQKDYPQVSASGNAVTKITYVNEGETVATRYTNSTGAMIGTAPADPTKENHNFIQWTETADGTAGDKLRTATFELKPAYIYVVEGETIATFYANSTEEFTPPADPTKAGYLFVQWNSAVEGKNTTYTAEFKQNWSVNGDEAVELRDVILLLQYLVGYDVEIDLACADVNKDGRVSIFDAVKLLQYYSSLEA